MNSREVEYEPVSVKEVLAEMKDTAELLIDLSYSAVLHGSDEVAAEVLELEARMDLLQLQGRMSLLMAARNPEDAEQLAPVLGVIGAAEKISNAAGDIAKVVIEDIGLPEAIRGALPEATETLVRATVADGSAYADRTLGDINMETETGVRTLAIRRTSATGKRRWITNPTHESRLEAGDVLLLRGNESGVATVVETVTGSPYEPPAAPEEPIEDLERAVDSIVLMKNMSELAVDLAYGSVLFDDPELAREVSELEVEVDALKERFEAWALRAAGELEEPVAIRGLLHIAASTEVISDAALEISEGVLRGLGSHPVVQAAVEASDEILVSVPVAAGSDLAGTTIGEQALRTTTGTLVIAIRRDGPESGTDWVLTPSPETRLHAGDTLITKGTRAGAERLRALAGVGDGADGAGSG